MEEKSQDPVGTEETQTASGEPQKSQEDKVAYESYRKLLNEKKSRDQRLQEMEQKLKSYEESELERKGEFEKLLSQLKEENSKLKSTLQEKDRKYIMNKVHSAIKEKAVAAGCKAPDKLLRLLDDDKVNGLEVDDNYNVVESSVEYLINEAKKENDFLFKRSNANVQDGNPVSEPVVKTPESDLSKLSMEQLEELYKKSYK